MPSFSYGYTEHRVDWRAEERRREAKRRTSWERMVAASNRRVGRA
jgi:hypothetical protein